ncbi:DUF4352 domain-containing protein [Kitasatospora sp. NBC_01287]|uniref:DUF4352 domain-containing protein n=1 Tax=Kitasatospora sp. NBC_01287 TaxID=2903573 RepID=UPI00225C1FE1|nr:DUF4352 domain-containing protein [Kitasatospora sp. NBC_01287]MCX4747102.1 DUF4352 domain-containing protein [Kitasatospora sp. NBC_01287]
MRSTATARRRSTSVALLAGGALLALATTACGPTSTNSVSTTPKKSTAAAAPSGQAAGGQAAGGTGGAASTGKAPSVAKVGDTIALKGQDQGSADDVTVVKVVDNAQSTPDGFGKPADGKRWIAVQFRLKNTGTAAYSDSPENGATVADDKGQSYTSVVADTTAGQSFASPVNNAPGDTALGFITFEVPADAKIVKAQFTLDSGFADQTGQWNLG